MLMFTDFFCRGGGVRQDIGLGDAGGWAGVDFEILLAALG